MKYKRLCEGLTDYGRFIPAEDSVYDHIKTLDTDSYLSVYNYTEAQKLKAEEEIEREGEIRPRGVAGIRDVETETLIFDFDIPPNSGITLDDVKDDTREAIYRLTDYGLNTDDMQITFSGSKGFGVLLKLEAALSPEQHKKIARKVTEGLKTWDSKVYNASRILRIPLTKHQKTGLFKMPLSIEDLDLSIDEIQEFASNNLEPKDIATWGGKVELGDNILKLAADAPKKEVTVDATDLSFRDKPKWLSAWKYALLNGFFPPGTRSSVMMILAATLKGQGLPKEVTGRMLKGAAELQASRFGQDKVEGDLIWGNHVKQVYDEFWEGGTYAEDNFPDELKDYLIEQGIPRTVEDETDESLIMGVEEQFKNFNEYAKEIDENTMATGIPSLDKVLKMRGGNLIGLLAPPGVGKTSFALTLLNNTSDRNIHSFFGSYDMSGNVLFQKLIQREMDIGEEDLYNAYRFDDKTQVDEFGRVLKENYNNVTFSFNTGQSVGALKNSIVKREEKLGHKIKLVIVDYLELIITKASDPTQASAEAIQGLREIANEGRVVVVLLQPNKMSSKVDEPALSYNASKGSSSIAQACTAVLTCHRPGMSSVTPDMDNFFSINCVKNRMGQLFALDFSWVGRTGRITEMDDKQKTDLYEVRRVKKALKEIEDEF